MILRELSVAGAFQRRGTGRSLLDCVLNYTRRTDSPEIWLTTDRYAPWGRKLYEMAGFVIVDHDNLPEAMRTLMTLEAEHGLRIEHRCAMRWRPDGSERPAARPHDF